MTSSFSLGLNNPTAQALRRGWVPTRDESTGITYFLDPITGKVMGTNDPRRTDTLGPIVKGLAIAGLAAGAGIAGAAAFGGAGGAAAGSLAAPTTAQASSVGSLFGAGGGGAGAAADIGGALAATAPEQVLITAAAPGWLTAAAPYLAGGAIGAGGLAASGAFDGGAIANVNPPELNFPSSQDLTSNLDAFPDSVDITPGVGGVPGVGQFTATGAGGGGLGGISLTQALGGVSALGSAAQMAGGGGIGGLGTETTTQNLTPQQQQYLQTQIDMANKQLELLDKQGAFQSGYLDSIRPLLDQQTKLMQQQYDAFTAAQNDPLNAQMQQQASQLLQQQIDSQNQIAPLQQQLLKAQLDQALNGGKATPEQLASIDAATGAAFDSGSSDINAASQEQMRLLRENLAPSLGLRPTDTPILDRGDLIGRESVRQLGQLRSNLAGVNANARINLPMAQQQIGNATAGNTANIALATQQFQQQLAQAAISNRMNLLSAGNNTANLGLTSGANLISAAKGGIPNFGGSTTVSNPGVGFSQLLGGLGGIGTGLGALGLRI